MNSCGASSTYTLACGRSTFTLDGARPWSLGDAVEFARLGDLFEPRCAAIYPLHAMEHDREQWYSLVMAQYDELMTGDFVAEEVWGRVGELLRDVVRGLISPYRGSAQ